MVTFEFCICCLCPGEGEACRSLHSAKVKIMSNQNLAGNPSEAQSCKWDQRKYVPNSQRAFCLCRSAPSCWCFRLVATVVEPFARAPRVLILGVGPTSPTLIRIIAARLVIEYFKIDIISSFRYQWYQTNHHIPSSARYSCTVSGPFGRKRPRCFGQGSGGQLTLLYTSRVEQSNSAEAK